MLLHADTGSLAERQFFFFGSSSKRPWSFVGGLFLPFFFIRAWSPPVTSSSSSARRSWLCVIGFIIVVWDGLGLSSQKLMSEDTMSLNSKYSSQCDSTFDQKSVPRQPSQVQRHWLAANTVKSIGLHALWIIRILRYSGYGRTRVRPLLNFKWWEHIWIICYICLLTFHWVASTRKTDRQTDSSTAYQEMNSYAVPYLLCVTESFIRSSMALVLHCYQDKQEIIIRTWQY